MFSKFRSQKIVNTSTLEYRAPSPISFLKAIRESVNSGTALGSELFKDEIEATLARSVRLGTPRRPRKKGDDDITRQCDLSLMRK